MAQQPADHRTNPSEEVIRVGQLTVHFLVTGENSSGTIAAFEVVVPGAQGLAAPAHSHDHYEETIYGIDGVLTWTVDGKQIDVGTRAGALHSARCRSPLRQQHAPGREGALPDHAGGDRSTILPRVCRGDQRRSRRAARPGKDGGDYAPPRVDSGSASGLDRLRKTLHWAGKAYLRG